MISGHTRLYSQNVYLFTQGSAENRNNRTYTKRQREREGYLLEGIDSRVYGGWQIPECAEESESCRPRRADGGFSL